MRTASRVFYSIAIFAVVALLLFAAGSGFDNVQGIAVLTSFAAACAFLGLLLGRQARYDLIGFEQAHAAGHDGEIHLPPPSWMPALYGVAGMLVVLGVLFSYAVLWAGVALLVLTTIGWARESVVEYRRELAHAVQSPGAPPPTHAALDIAHRVAGFAHAHGGADAVVQHLGRGTGEVVLVGADGVWGNFTVHDVATGRAACELAGVTLHERWPGDVAARVRPDEGFWRRMGGENPFRAPAHGAPRDGTTQVAARVFLSIGVFAFAAAALFYLPQRSWDAAQGTLILTCFAVANVYLYVALRNARARPEDAAFTDEHYVTKEPEQPPQLDPETLHLPGPSWWPAVFSLAGGAIVLGLAFSYTVLWIGVMLLVVSAVGWAIESVREYRAQIAHGAHATDAAHGGGRDADHANPHLLSH